MTNLCLKGQVYSGKGEGTKFTSLGWAKRRIEKKLGFALYSGTLNIHLDRESVEARASLKDKGFEIHPAPGYCSSELYEAKVSGIRCGIIVPQVPRYPRNVLELVSSLNLREKLGLSDGSWVVVEVTL